MRRKIKVAFKLYFFSTEEGGKGRAALDSYRAPILWGANYTKQEVIDAKCNYKNLQQLPLTQFIDAEFYFKESQVAPGNYTEGEAFITFANDIVSETLAKKHSVLVLEPPKIVAWGHLELLSEA